MVDKYSLTILMTELIITRNKADLAETEIAELETRLTEVREQLVNLREQERAISETLYGEQK